MIFTVPAIVALAAGAVSASPVEKRQATSSAASDLTLSPVGTVTVAVPTVIASPVDTLTVLAPTLVSGASDSMASSMASGVSTMSMGGAMTNSSASNSSAGNPLYPCPSGYSLSYVKTQMNYDYPLSEVIDRAGNFQNATWMYYLNGTGGNTVGATRYLATNNGSKTEVLSQYFTDMENVAVQLVMNLTSGPISAPNGAMLSNYSTVGQIYTNTSASTAGNNVTTVKLFCNFCAAEQMTGMEAVLSSLNMNLENLQTLLMGGMLTYPGPNVNPAGNMTMGGNMTMSGSSTTAADMSMMTGSSSMMSGSGLSFGTGLVASTTAISISGSSVSVVVPEVTGSGASITATETVSAVSTSA